MEVYCTVTILPALHYGDIVNAYAFASLLTLFVYLDVFILYSSLRLTLKEGEGVCYQ